MDREAIVAALKDKIKQSEKALVGNKGYRKYLKLSGTRFQIDEDKIKEESRYDGKWVLTTNTSLPSREVALQYKQLWMVEQIFRSIVASKNGFLQSTSSMFLSLRSFIYLHPPKQRGRYSQFRHSSFFQRSSLWDSCSPLCLFLNLVIPCSLATGFPVKTGTYFLNSSLLSQGRRLDSCFRRNDKVVFFHQS